jgi:endogenous inhibitor of DNA gyrase (YacG/DUF329 family)
MVERLCPRCGRPIQKGPRAKWCSETCRVLDAQRRRWTAGGYLNTSRSPESPRPPVLRVEIESWQEVLANVTVRGAACEDVGAAGAGITPRAEADPGAVRAGWRWNHKRRTRRLRARERAGRANVRGNDGALASWADDQTMAQRFLSPARIGKTGQIGTALYPEAGICVIDTRHPRASGSESVVLALGAG